MECLSLLIALCCIVWFTKACLDGEGEDCSKAYTEDQYRYFSTRTAYKQTQNKQPKHEQVPGCTSKAIFMLIRHGIRYPAKDEVSSMNKYLPEIVSSARSLDGRGRICPESLERLKKWKNPFTGNEDMTLAPTGIQEMEDLGFNWKVRFPSLFHLDSSLDLQYTDKWRSVVSAKHFLMGATNQADNVFKMQYGYAVPRHEDKKLLYCDICYNYIKERLNKTDQEKIETSLFDDGIHVSWMLKRVNDYLGLSDGVLSFVALKSMFEACRFGYAVHDDDTWCEAIPTDVIKLMEYRQDMKYYWRYGHGQSINYQPSCVLVEDLIQSFSKVQENNTGYNETILRFGHSRSLLPFLVRLGLFNDTERLYADNYHKHISRQWQLARINPFSSNIAFILYQCDSGYHIRTFLNEHEIILPGCSEALCPMNTLLTHWKNTIGVCNFDEICHQNDMNPDFLKELNQNHFHHV